MTHYQTLQIAPQASQEEIKQAYRRLAKLFHPDSSENSSNSCDRIVALNAAYEVLGNIQSRRLYDRQLQLELVDYSLDARQARNARATQQYRRYRQAEQSQDFDYRQWLQQIYIPIERLIGQIIEPLALEIDDLAADPFDDELMENFDNYLENCRGYLQLARQTFSSQPNPSQLAGVAANVYYCLDRLSDGLEELEYFTLNYDDRHLHMGQEIFRIARDLCDRAREKIRAT